MSLFTILLQEVKDSFHAASCTNKVVSRISSAKKISLCEDFQSYISSKVEFVSGKGPSRMRRYHREKRRSLLSSHLFSRAFPKADVANPRGSDSSTVARVLPCVLEGQIHGCYSVSLAFMEQNLALGSGVLFLFSVSHTLGCSKSWRHIPNTVSIRVVKIWKWGMELGDG